MTALPERSSPLAAWSERFKATSTIADRFSIRELPVHAQIGLRGDLAQADFRARAAAALGFELPDVNTWSGGADRHALWLGPDEWLLVASNAQPDELERDLREALRGLRHAVVDLSANRAVLELSGGEARLVLAKGSPLNLRGSAFAPPAAAQTLLAKAPVILQCLERRPTFRLYVRNSIAAYLAEWLVDAAGECAASRGLDTERLVARLAT